MLAGHDPAALASALRTRLMCTPFSRRPDPPSRTGVDSVLMARPNTEIGTAHAGPGQTCIQAAIPPGTLVGGNQTKVTDAACIIAALVPCAP